MNPTIVVVSQFSEWREVLIIEITLLVAVIACQLAKEVEGQLRRRVFLGKNAPGKCHTKFGSLRARNRDAEVINPVDASTIARDRVQMLGGVERGPRQIDNPYLVPLAAMVRLELPNHMIAFPIGG